MRKSSQFHIPTSFKNLVEMAIGGKSVAQVTLCHSCYFARAGEDGFSEGQCGS